MLVLRAACPFRTAIDDPVHCLHEGACVRYVNERIPSRIVDPHASGFHELVGKIDGTCKALDMAPAMSALHKNVHAFGWCFRCCKDAEVFATDALRNKLIWHHHFVGFFGLFTLEAILEPLFNGGLDRSELEVTGVFVASAAVEEYELGEGCDTEFGGECWITACADTDVLFGEVGGDAGPKSGFLLVGEENGGGFSGEFVLPLSGDVLREIFDKAEANFEEVVDGWGGLHFGNALSVENAP